MDLQRGQLNETAVECLNDCCSNRLPTSRGMNRGKSESQMSPYPLYSGLLFKCGAPYRDRSHLGQNDSASLQSRWKSFLITSNPIWLLIGVDVTMAFHSVSSRPPMRPYWTLLAFSWSFSLVSYVWWPQYRMVSLIIRPFNYLHTKIAFLLHGMKRLLCIITNDTVISDKLCTGES